jgi:hypothetical protein
MAQAIFTAASIVCCLATSVAVKVGSSYEEEQNMAATDAGMAVFVRFSVRL